MTESIIKAFIYLRRSIRQRHAIIDDAVATRTSLLRMARKLDAGSAFDQALAATCRARHAALSPEFEDLLEWRRQLGRELLTMAPQFDAATTFEQRLDLLNVNAADRAGIDAGAGLMMIMAGHCLEDSAARRGEHHHSGPLFDSVLLNIILAMSSTAESRAATDKVMVDVFGARAYSLFGQKPDLQLVSTTTPPTTAGE